MRVFWVLCFLLVDSAFAGDHWYIVIDPSTGVEMKSYYSADVEPTLSPSGRVRVEITKREYDADKDVAPADRLKNIPNSKARIAAATTNAYNAKAESEYSKVEVTLTAQNAKLSPANRVSKADWIAAWKAVNTNLTEAIKPSKEIK